MKHNQPEHVTQAQVVKACSSSLDTYHLEQLIEVSKWCLIIPSSKTQLVTYLRDHAMLLMSTAMAFHGDNLHTMNMSDLYLKESLCVLFHNAKHNQNGKLEEQAAIPHENPLMCAIGALAMHLFTVFHLSGHKFNFMPQYSTKFGELGNRIWYGYKAFFPRNDLSKEMGYENHCERFSKMHKANGIMSTKVTHVGWVFRAFYMRQQGTSVEDAKVIGLWSSGGSFGAAYDREVLLEGLLGAAGFDPREPKAHFLARDILDVPSELEAQLFPWAETEEAALSQCSSVPEILGGAKEQACIAPQNLPQQWADSVRGIVQTGAAMQWGCEEHQCKELMMMHEELRSLHAHVELMADALQSKHRKLVSAPQYTVPTSSFRQPIPTSIPCNPTNTKNTFRFTMPPVSEQLPSLAAPVSSYAASSVSTNVSTGATHTDQLMAQKWATLCGLYSEQQLRIHTWEWTKNNWVPYYKTQSIAAIDELWEEYTVGLNRYLPVRELWQ
ncbi:hypothetical protein M422DRAFT_246051 [Sphaerobolus stellatus SS14]|nr:hypothetical protein M422DRAFT_246051 [Sphaerobolus stellatus SS14]